MNPEYHVVRARVRDVSHLPAIELRAAALLAGYAPASVLAETTDVVRLHRACAEGRLWVALQGDVPIGFAHVELLDAGSAHLQELDVLPEHGRRGLGRSLVAAVCSWAERQQYPFVTLTTFRDVPWNMPFYQRLGFAEVPGDEITPALALILTSEARSGLDPQRRVAMRRPSNVTVGLPTHVRQRVRFGTVE